MKKLITLFLFTGITFLAYSQDYIYLKNNTRIPAIVREVALSNVIYKDYNDQDGPDLMVKVSDVSLIAYQDGHLEFFEPVSRIIQRNDYNPNLLTYHLFDLIFNNFTISYERILKNGKVGLQIPISFGYSHYANIDDIYNMFYTGLNVNFYPTGQGKWRFLTGPGFRIGQARWDYYSYHSETSSHNYEETTGYFKLLVNNGVIFSPIKELSLSVVGSLGIRYVFTMPKNYKYQIRTTGAFAVNLAYRF